MEKLIKTQVQLLGSYEQNHLFVKREDLIPVSFGGNKARKALYFFDEIDAGDYDTVVTYGSSSSNHCRVICNLASSRGLASYIISPEEASAPTFNSQMMQMFGAKIIICPVSEVHTTIEKTVQTLIKQGRKPYFIQGGGHGNLGTQAYVDCYQEICRYEQENHIHFDYIFHASGTGTTQAGLICGQLLCGDARKIVGISIARKCPRGRDVVLNSVKDYMQEHACAFAEQTLQELTEFDDSYTGSGYGAATEEIQKTIESWLIHYGIPLDATYTGKAVWGMNQYLKEHQITGKNILFIHTGGTPLFFDYLRNRE